MRPLWLLLLLFGCGEVERVELTVRPRQDDFREVVRPLLLQVGCTGEVCHGIKGGGGGLFLPTTEDEAAVQEAYLFTKLFLDTEAAEESKFLSYCVCGGGHRPACFSDPESCAYRKLVAWIGWQGEGDPRPQDVDCEITESECFVTACPPSADDSSP